MIGTLINTATILIGGALGLLFGSRLPDRVRQTVVSGMGLFVVAIGLQMFLKTTNPLIVLGSLLFGGLLGEWWQIEDRMRSLGRMLEKRFGQPETDPEPTPAAAPVELNHIQAKNPRKDSRFVRGFLTSSLLFCIGPMAILGSVQDGLVGDYRLLTIKSILDGFASLAFASTLGIGVLFSSVMVLAYQGGISLLAAQAQTVFTTSMMNELTATGGVLLLGIGISGLLEMKQIRVGSFLPSLAVAPLIVAILDFLKLI